MASTSSSSTNSTLTWDVFLSYRGPDTGPTFTGHLYAALDRHGIQAYKDDYKLRLGDVISDALREAIKKSRIYIVVFSVDYAASPWCLAELVEIVKHSKTEHRLVIPVFHNIDPSVVRHLTGSFEAAFKVHQEGYYKNQIQKVDSWRAALKEAADVSGEHVCEKNREETDVIERIVAEILPRINPKGLDEETVGLDAHVESIAAMLRTEHPKSVTKIGIYGMGGVGKTTLARAVFTRIYLQFDGSCFLADATANSGTKNGMKSLQNQLLNEVLLQRRNDVNDVVQGEKLIKSRIKNKRILVVIDDLNHSYQHKSLGVESYAHGSVVIVTTREEEILAAFNVKTEHRYMVNPLGPIDSLALFKQHAFGFDAEPDNTLMGMSKDILSYADGLPLALEVFGSLLRTKYTVDEWKDFIEKLKETPNKEIQDRLLISFNAINDDPQVKSMFLDVACFFIGWPKERVVKVLETYYTYVDVKIKNLKERCLLTFHRGKLQMHDLLRDMGREVARNNSRDEPWKHSRLWISETIHEVLSEEDEVTKAIEGIFYNDEREAPMALSLETKTFAKMKKLRFLHLRGFKYLVGNFDQAFKDLRWLCWYRCPLESFPPELKAPHLGILELQYSVLRTLQLVMVFKKLKTLDMSHSLLLLATPDFNMLPCLVSLNFAECESLKEVDSSIGSLTGLVSLVLEGCRNIKNLPDTIGHLKALEVLDVSRTSLVELPEELGSITSLKVLNIHTTTVRYLPNSIGDLNNLVELILRCNYDLRTLPDTICNLSSLEILEIGNCKNLKELPSQMQKITSLRELISRNTAISKVELSQIPLSLKRLDFSGCGLTALPFGISQLSELEYLDIQECTKLLSIEELPPNLIKLEASQCLSMISFRVQANVKHLEILNLEDCRSLKEIQGLEYFTSLKKFELLSCYQLLSIGELPPNLIELEAYICPSMTNFRIQGDMKHLKTLSLKHCSGLEEIQGLEYFTSLKKIELLSCSRLLSIGELPPTLRWIKALNCISLKRLPNLSNLKQLEILDLAGCNDLTEIQGWEELSSVREFILGDCSESLRQTFCTKRFFQVCSEFKNEIKLYLLWRFNWPSWMSELSNLESRATVCLDLTLNKSDNYLGMILCFEVSTLFARTYEVRNITSGVIWRGSIKNYHYGRYITIIPRAIFSVKNGDCSLEFTADRDFCAIHLLYSD